MRLKIHRSTGRVPSGFSALAGWIAGTAAFFCFSAFVQAEEPAVAPPPAPAPAREAPEPEAVPDVRVFIMQMQAQITPERIRTFVMPAVGHVNNWLPDRDREQKGAIIATVNEEDMELKRRELEIQILKDKTAKRDEIVALRKQLEEINFYAGLTPEEKRWHDKKNPSDKEAIQSLKEKISLAEKELELIDIKPRRDFEKEEENYVLRMPFDGRLQYQFTLPADEAQAVYLEPSTPIATVCDDSAYYITVSISNPDLTRLDPATLRVDIPLASGGSMSGTFSHKRVEKNPSTGGNILAYFFKLPPAQHDAAHGMIGSNCTARLYYVPNTPVILLDKMALASCPAAKTSASWQELLEAVHPEYELILEGESQLIARKK